MAWNEPGNGKDPWKREEPNDLDKIVQNWQNRLGRLLGGGRGGPGGGGAYFLVVFALIAWALTGLYRVDEAERGIVQRFGAYERTTMPGLRWHWPFPVETVNRINTLQVERYAFQTEMLTADQQYVDINMVVQYQRNDPIAFSFNIVDPEQTLEDVTESALREVVGTSEIESLIQGRREEIASRTQTVLQATLDSYSAYDSGERDWGDEDAHEGAGIRITSISLEDVKYPQNVQEAVDDAQRARNDAARFLLEADTYANDIIPRARGRAARMLEDARAYRDRVIADAEGEAARFLALLAEYERAPRVTRDRLYLDAVEEVYANSNKIIIDSEGSGNLLYLPIDRLMNASPASPPMPDDSMRSADPNTALTAPDVRASDDARDRRTRQ